MRRTSCRGRAAKTVAPDDLTVWVGTPSVYLTLSLNQDRDAPRRSLQHRMIRRLGLSDGRVEANRDDLVAGSSAPDDPTDRQCTASEQLCQRISTAMWRGRGTGWTDALENLASVHPTLPFLVAVSQRLVWCLGLFIPLHSPIWGCWIVWKCRGVQDTYKIISNPSKCSIAHP
jgi:hypothetical protein